MNGKGSKDRTKDARAFRKNFGRIKWRAETLEERVNRVYKREIRKMSPDLKKLIKAGHYPFDVAPAKADWNPIKCRFACDL